MWREEAVLCVPHVKMKAMVVAVLSQSYWEMRCAVTLWRDLLSRCRRIIRIKFSLMVNVQAAKHPYALKLYSSKCRCAREAVVATQVA